jgi:hypothetical protein
MMSEQFEPLQSWAAMIREMLANIDPEFYDTLRLLLVEIREGLGDSTEAWRGAAVVSEKVAQTFKTASRVALEQRSNSPLAKAGMLVGMTCGLVVAEADSHHRGPQ